MKKNLDPQVFSGADSGFPTRRIADPAEGGAGYDFVKFSSKKLHKIKNFWGVGAPPLDPPLDRYLE